MKKTNYILGIFPSINASACILKNGKIDSFMEEERLNRIKMGGDNIPIKSIEYCLNKSKIKLKDIHVITVGWDCKKYPKYMKNYSNKYLKGKKKIDNIIEQKISIGFNPNYLRFRLKTELAKLGFIDILPKIRYIRHHLSHAYSTFYLSGYKESLILTSDGSGEENSTVLWKGTSKGIKEIQRINLPNSLGWFYTAMTEFLGFDAHTGEGKLMGLAPYGKPNKIIHNKLKKIIQIKESTYKINPKYIYFYKRTYNSKFTDKLVNLLGIPRQRKQTITQLHKDIAYETQELLEEAIITLIKYGMYKTKITNVCMSGGISMNCKANGKINQLSKVKKLFVLPMSSDNGTSIGSALKVYKELNPKFKSTKLHSIYLGLNYSNIQIKKVLEQCKLKHKYHKNIDQIIAKDIYNNKIVGWFQGQMEAGARALGNRSILANPLNKNMKKLLNEQVKHRESFRPFCPSIKAENKENYINNTKNTDYMTIAYQAKKGLKKLMPSIVHTDNSIRPQTVTKKQNIKFWKLLNEFGKLTKHPVLLNTSFNIAGEPIVCTPEEAIRCFYGTGIDCLAIGNYYITKDNKK